MKTEQSMENVLLSKITVGNTNPRKYFDDKAMKELTESVKINGVIQPVLLRIGKNGEYELVCGERRYRAAKLAGRKDIPALIREMSPEEALELQIVENLQRKDVSPMEEAAGFKNLIETNKMATLEIAHRVGKSESYVALRIKLNDLAPSYQKAMHKGALLLGDALWLCRLSKEDQEFIYKEERHADDERIELADYTKKEYSNDLNKAPFNTKDPILFKEMGACTTCVFNSACVGSLFPDLEKGKATCQKSSCFKKKCSLSFASNLKEAKEDPAVVFCTSDFQTDANVKKQLDASGHKMYNRNQYSPAKKTTPKALKAFVMSGNDKGKYTYIVLTERTTSKPAKIDLKANEGKVTATDINAEIKRMTEAEVRKQELDEEKLAPKIYNLIEETEGYLNNKAILSEAEMIAAILCLISAMGWARSDEYEQIMEKAGFKEKGEEIEMFTFLKKNPNKRFDIFHQLTRLFILDKTNRGARACASSDDTVRAFQGVAMEYAEKEVETLLAEIVDERKKRAERLQQKIEELKKLTKAAPKKATPKKK